MRKLLPYLALVALVGCRDATAPDIMAFLTIDAVPRWDPKTYSCLGTTSPVIPVDPHGSGSVRAESLNASVSR